MAYPPRPLADRFWEKVDKTPGHGPWGDCWLWTGGANHGPDAAQNYGLIWVNEIKKKRLVHVVSYEMHFGPVPDCPDADFRGPCVLHRCDMGLCVRPEHLWVGSNQQNLTDCAEKQRMHPGSKNGKSTHTEEEIAEIRQLYATGGFTQQELGDRFNMHRSMVSYIVNRKNWRHM